MTMLLTDQKNSVWVCRLSNILMILLLCGCAVTNTVSGPGQSPAPVGAVSSIHHGVSLAVWLEDLCESQETDAQSLTMLEALHDGLVIPTEALFAVTVVTVAGTVWSVYDRIMLPDGESLPNRPQMVLEYVKPHWAGPQPDSTKSHGTHLPIAWSGCLSAYGEAKTSYYPGDLCHMNGCLLLESHCEIRRLGGGLGVNFRRKPVAADGKPGQNLSWCVRSAGPIDSY